MKKQLIAAALLSLWLAALPGRPAAAAAISLRDDGGQLLQLAQPPQRIVSLIPSLTETVCALGACARLVGVDRYSDYPPAVAALPRLGGLDDTPIEAIVALRPDVVLASPASRVEERLRALGIKVLVLEARNHADARRVLFSVAQLLGQPEPLALWQGIEAAAARAAATVPAAARGASVYYEVDSAPYAAGAASFIGETLARLGLQNIAPAALGPFPKLNPEFVVRADPQLIMIAQRNAASLAGRPGWAGIRALREQRVCVLGADEAELVARPGPRMAEAATILADCLRRLYARP